MLLITIRTIVAKMIPWINEVEERIRKTRVEERVISRGLEVILVVFRGVNESSRAQIATDSSSAR